MFGGDGCVRFEVVGSIFCSEFRVVVIGFGVVVVFWRVFVILSI